MKLEQSKEPPLPEVVADMNDSNDWHETQRAIHDKVRELENLKCDQDTWRLDAPITVGQSLGGRIARIRVLHYLSRMKRIPLSTEPRLSDVREEMHKVWTGKFDGSACNIMWAEMTSWDLQAILEFDDGRTAVLVTDGWHVAMQNRDGNVRFFRLLHDAP